jgi:flagellar export protein FliJ
MGFRFPLATVLQVRESIERREERALQRIQLDMTRVERQIEEFSTGIAKAHGSREEALRQTIPASHLQAMLSEAQSAVERKIALLRILQTLEEQRITQMKVYQAAHRDHETVLEMFREQRDEYARDQARAQQKFLDDIFMARRHRN